MADWEPNPAFAIDTPRLTISYLLSDHDDHCDFIVALYNSPLFVANSGKTGITTPESAKRFINGRIKGLHSKYGFGIYLVTLKEDSRLIGTIQMSQGDDFPVPDIGFAFLPEATGKGHATEAGHALMVYAEKEYGVKEVLGFCDPKNAKSVAVLKRLGMEDRGVKNLKPFGESAVFALPEMKDMAKYGIP